MISSERSGDHLNQRMMMEAILYGFVSLLILICYWCGRLAHDDKQCKLWIRSRGSLTKEQKLDQMSAHGALLLGVTFLIQIPSLRSHAEA